MCLPTTTRTTLCKSLRKPQTPDVRILKACSLTLRRCVKCVTPGIRALMRVVRKGVVDLAAFDNHSEN